MRSVFSLADSVQPHLEEKNVCSGSLLVLLVLILFSNAVLHYKRAELQVLYNVLSLNLLNLSQTSNCQT